MKGRYSKELFWMGFVTNLLFRHFYLSVPAVILMLTGIWSRICLLIGLIVLLIDAILSVIEQMRIMNAVETSDHPGFAPFQQAILSENWRENLKETMENQESNIEEEEKFEKPEMREFILDGDRFDDLEGFYDEIDRLLTKGLDWKTGHNLDAFNDLLCGGFGVHEYGEPIRIKWTHYRKSKKDLGDQMFLKLLEIMLNCDNTDHWCTVELYAGDADEDCGK